MCFIRPNPPARNNGPVLLAVIALAATALCTVSPYADDRGSRPPENLRLTQSAQTVLPTDWLLSSEALDFPFQLVYAGEGAEILLFRSVFDGEDLITNQEELRLSVDRVVGEVIETLPEGRLLTSTGFYDTYRAGFVLEFTSVDTLEEVEMRHRLAGIIYRHPDDYQMLFTIWGKSTIEQYGRLAGDIRLVQERFVYSGPQEPYVFGKPVRKSYWLLLLAGMLTIGLVFMVRRRKRIESRSESTDVDRTWTCGCGRVNFVDSEVCRRCGRGRRVEPVV